MPVSPTPELLRELAELYRRAAELEERAGLAPGAGAPPGTPSRPGALPPGLHEALGELSDDAVAVFTPAADIVYVNSAAERLFGYRPEELVGKNAWSFLHGEDLPAVAAARSSPLDVGVPLELRVRCADGSLRWTEFTARPWPSAAHRYVVARWRESGGRRGDADPADEAARLARQLRRAHALARISRLALGLPQISDVLAAAAAMAPAAMELEGGAYLELETSGLRVHAEAGFPEGTRGRTVPLVMTLAGLAWASGAPARAADVQRDGRLADPLLERGRWGSAVAIPVRGKERVHGVLLVAGRSPRQLDAEEIHFLEAVADVVATSLDGQAAQERLAGRERLAQALFEHAREGMALVDVDGRVVEANEAAARTLGVSREALCGRRPAELVPSGLDLAARHGAERSAEVAVTTPVGPRTLQLERIPGVGPGLDLVVLRDVTERKDMLARLALADRLISVGTLAGGVAHELKTPLAYVAANLNFLDQALREGDAQDQEVGEALRDAIEGTARLKAIVDDLRTFVRSPGSDEGTADVEAVLRSCVGMTWAEIQARARLERSLEPLPPVVGNPARLAQVFVNLLVNAAQAIPEGASQSNVIRLVARSLGPDRVAVEVSDTGAGIPPAVLPHIFEPFFTTKGPAVGTGLGLSICRSIVEGLGGAIEVQSEPGRGSTFRVILPVVPADERRPHAEAAAARSRVLVVEEALEVGQRIRDLLGDEHEVTVVSPGQARDRVAHGERFDAVLAGVAPERGALDLRAELVRHDPGLAGRVVLLQGGEAVPGLPSLDEPVQPEAVRATLARVLAMARSKR